MAGSVELLQRLESSAELQSVDIGGAAFVWRSWGEGSPVVLLHGAAGSWTHWVCNIEPLAAKRRVLAPDLPGFGDSGLPPELDSAKQLAGQTVAAIDVLLGEGTKVDLVGFSFGAIVAGLAAARLGRRVPRLGLIGAGGIGMSGRVPEVENDILDPRDPAATERAELARFMFASTTAVDDCALKINRQNIERARFSQDRSRHRHSFSKRCRR